MNFFRRMFFCLLFVIQTTGFEKNCHNIGNNEFFCLRQHENGQLKALEFTRQRSPSPEAALYFYPDGALLSFLDRREKNYLLFQDKLLLKESLIGNHYQYFSGDTLTSECIDNDCIHYKHDFSSPSTIKLQTGDVVFTGNLNYYSGSAKAIFTHVDIITEIKDNKPWSISSDVMSKAEIQPLNESFSNTLNWIILRNKKFSELFINVQQKVSAAIESQQTPPQIFCTDFFANLYRQINPQLFQKLDYFSTVFAEILVYHALNDFEVIDYHFAEFSDPDDFRKKRISELEKLKQQWQILISNPTDFLYHSFLLRFPFLPIIHEEKKLQQLLQYFGNGLFQENPPTAQKTLFPAYEPTITETNNPLRSCFKTAALGQLCIEKHESGTLKLLEEYPADKSRTPQLAFYFYDNGQPMIYMDWHRKKYLAFNPDGSLSEKMIDTHYIHLENNTPVLICEGNNCQSKKYSFAAPKAQKMQVGDLIFSANLYPHNGHFKNHLTHIAIFAGHQNGEAVVFTNDIAENPQIIEFTEAFSNTVNYVVLRNQDFSREFSEYFTKFQAGETLRNPKIAHFCGNTLVTLISRLYPKITKNWDNIDKNHSEIIFCNIYKLFTTIDFRLFNHRNPDDLYKKMRIKTIKTKSDIAFIMKNPHNFLYAMFSKNFSPLPITFEREKIEQILFFMYYHYPLEL